MRKSMKCFLSSFMAILGSLVFVNFAKASGVTVENNTTGADSTNDASVDINAQKTINISNEANVANNIRIYANTGNNSASQNTGDGKIVTGDVSVRSSASTDVNRVDLKSASGNSIGMLNASNKTTGAHSDNNSIVNLSQPTEASIRNNAQVNNCFYSEVNTGRNSADKNTGDGFVMTGDAASSARFSTKANETAVDFSDGSAKLNVILANEKTGYSSENNAVAEISRALSLNVDNFANINNSISADINTGLNSADKNTGDGTVKSGDAASCLAIHNAVNNAIVKASEDGWGSIRATLLNQITGAYSDNSAELIVNDSENIYVNNRADINNRLHSNVNTGYNTADKNTGDGFAQSGDVQSDFSIETKANIAKVEAAAGSSHINVEAKNQQTGCESDNTVAATIENGLNLCIENNAWIDNFAQIGANTGHNSASKNTGDGYVSSGDIDLEGEFETAVNIVDLSKALMAKSIEAEAINKTTGAESENTADFNIDSQASLSVLNNNDIENNACIETETGQNTADKNTEDGKILSGCTKVEINAESKGGIVTSDRDSCDDADYCFENAIQRVLSGEGNMFVKVNGVEVM